MKKRTMDQITGASTTAEKDTPESKSLGSKRLKRNDEVDEGEKDEDIEESKGEDSSARNST